MSELINAGAASSSIRKELLATVCGLALLTVGAQGRVFAAETDRPTVWLELGGQLEHLSESDEAYRPPFQEAFDHLPLKSAAPVQKPLRYSVGGEGKLTFEPAGMDWRLSASIRYGRSNGQKASQQQLPLVTYYIKTLFGGPGTKPGWVPTPYHLNASSAGRESHTILDFQVGKDVGLGLFSMKDHSTVSLGVRFAQFDTRKQATINGLPHIYHHGSNIKYGILTTHRNYFGTFEAARSFHGIGPSLSWDGSHTVAEGGNDTKLNLDWGINAAVLFGRQKVRGETGETGQQYNTYRRINIFQGTTIAYTGVASSYHHHMNINRSRGVVVPNIGATAGFSLQFPNAKIAFGYRADFFFGAMDTGIDSRKTSGRNFYGPFATISMGLGG